MPIRKAGKRRLAFCTCSSCSESCDAVESLDIHGQPKRGLWIADTTERAHQLAEQRDHILAQLNNLAIAEVAAQPVIDHEAVAAPPIPLDPGSTSTPPQLASTQHSSEPGPSSQIEGYADSSPTPKLFDTGKSFY